MNTKTSIVTKIGRRIKEFRLAKQMTQQEVANILCIEVRNYAKIEKGERKILDVLLIIEICNILEVDIVELLTGKRTNDARPVINLSEKEQTNIPDKHVADEKLALTLNKLAENINEIEKKQGQLQHDFNKIIAGNNLSQ